MNSAVSPPRSIRSFVLRCGRMTASQKRAFEQYWPAYGIDINPQLPEPEPVDLAALFQRSAPIVLEIGFGMGDSLLAMAKAEPDYNFIGIEVHTPGVGRLLNQIARHELPNLRIVNQDANVFINQFIADESLRRLQVYFPDPWHKKRHHKRRLIQSDWVQRVCQKLEPCGQIHLATDWQPYAEHMLTVLEQVPRLRNLSVTGGYLPQRPAYRPITKFEQRGAGLGHGVWDLLFEKKG